MKEVRRQLLRQAAGLGTLFAMRGSAASLQAAVQIGVLLPRSGYLAGAGDACFQGVRLAQKLLPQLGLPPFIVREGDTGETPESALRAAEKLIDAGAHLLVGCYDSGQTVAVAALAEERAVPMVINIAAAPSITEQGYRYIFRNFPDARRIVLDSYALQKELFVTTGFTPRKVVVLYINNGRGIETIEELWPQMHMPYEMAASIAYDPKAPDLSQVISAARDSGADALWTVSRADDAIRITRELVRQNWTPTALMSSNAGLNDASYRDALGKDADYAVTFAPYYDPSKPLSKRLKALQSRLEPHVPLGTLQVYTFEALLIGVNAYQSARSSDPRRLAAALRTTDIRTNVTPGPGISFDGKGQNQGLRLIAIQNLRGEGRVVSPSEVAESRPVLPMPAWSARG